MRIELAGLELTGHHGVLEEERRRGQRFVFDLWLELPDARAHTDLLADTIDYRDAVEVVRSVSSGNRFALLEALAAAVADALVERFEQLQRVGVRVRKPDVVLTAPVDYAAVSVEREGLRSST
ncbi:MAG: dihydroneopterin aldolase [Actinobacteria bacterium]|nr:dihydroneopterin aldolase [Actinomycetota bacterium]